MHEPRSVSNRFKIFLSRMNYGYYGNRYTRPWMNHALNYIAPVQNKYDYS